jgi:DNA repair protein SbcC/Rad50
MIPLCISIEGFLCYRQRQVIDLSDMSLCMLAGPNGSGKSSAFDAMTFALFGEHRAGSRMREDLINKRSDTATVELDFELNAARWQARRTLVRRRDGTAQTTQSIRRWSATKNGWEPVPDTSTNAGFSNWVEHHVGLNIDTFTSSMLLRQGKADRLLTATPADRHDLLSAVVGLDRYVGLHERANDHRKVRADRRAALEAKLSAMPRVSGEDLAAAAAKVAASKAACHAADALVEKLQPLNEQAKNWWRWDQELHQAQAERARLDGLLAQADDLEKQWKRLCELRAVLPQSHAILDNRARRTKSAEAIEALDKQAKSTSSDRTQLQQQIEALKASLSRETAAAQKDSDAERERSARLASLKVTLAQAQQVVGQRKQLEQLRRDRAALPADPPADLAKARAEEQRLADLKAALPWLAQLRNQSDVIRQARQELHERQAEQGEADKARAAAVAELDVIAPRFTAAEAAHRAAQEHDALTLAELKHARNALKGLADAEGNAECPTCGHVLTPEHLAMEQARREVRVRSATEAREAGAQQLRAAKAAVEGLQRTRADIDARRATAEVRHAEATRAVRSLCGEIEKAAKACAANYRCLPPGFRDRVGAIEDTDRAPDAWAMITWPSNSDLAALQGESNQLPDAKAAAATAERTCAKWNELSAQTRMLEMHLAEAAPDAAAADVQALQERYERMVAEQQSLRKAIERAKQAAAEHQRQLDELQAKTETLAQQLAQVQATRAAEQARIESLDEALAKAQADLPGDWGRWPIEPAALASLEQEMQALEQSGTEQSHQRLTEAQAHVVAIQGRLAMLTENLEAIPTEARQDPLVIAQRLDDTRRDRADHQAALQDADARHRKLEADRQARADAEQQYKAADREHRLYKRLSDLLGRDELQLHLMRTAEREIVQYANAVLDRISLRDIELRLRPAPEGEDTAAGSDRVLDLQAIHHRTAAQDAFAVAFLSGSQQFRVAVALALAIGQYAGGGNRLGECVVIDEGFGSLDREGQEVMIDELRNLQGIMKRIILVSHQESFADKFHDGYRFGIQDGETRVERMSA